MFVFSWHAHVFDNPDVSVLLDNWFGCLPAVWMCCFCVNGVGVVQLNEPVEIIPWTAAGPAGSSEGLPHKLPTVQTLLTREAEAEDTVPDEDELVAVLRGAALALPSVRETEPMETDHVIRADQQVNGLRARAHTYRTHTLE